jgi:hypothetical protein
LQEEQVKDFRVTYHGSITLVKPLTDAATNWIDDNVVTDETQFWAGALVVEPRYLENLREGMILAGLEEVH